MSQHHLGLHNIQLVFHFCLYIPCDTKCRNFLRMAPLNIEGEHLQTWDDVPVDFIFLHMKKKCLQVKLDSSVKAN